MIMKEWKLKLIHRNRKNILVRLTKNDKMNHQTVFVQKVLSPKCESKVPNLKFGLMLLL